MSEKAATKRRQQLAKISKSARSFSLATSCRQRIVLAKDALALNRAGLLQLDTDKYCAWNICLDSIDEYETLDELFLSVCDSSPPISVCAIGALFVANALRVPFDLTDVSYTRGSLVVDADEMIDFLSCFDPIGLALIETAFQRNRNYVCLQSFCTTPPARLAVNAVRFGENARKKTHTDCGVFEAVMNNIIENGGFHLETQPSKEKTS